MSSAGRAVSTNGCVSKPKERATGLQSCVRQIRSSSLTGSYVMETAERQEPYESRGSRTVVCPAKAGMFSRRQTCRGKSQAPRSLDSRVAGNQDSEAYRQGLPGGDYESPGRNESERASGLENEWIRGPSLQLKGEGSKGCRNRTEAAPRSRRGGSDSKVARAGRATGDDLTVQRRH